MAVLERGIQILRRGCLHALCKGEKPAASPDPAPVQAALITKDSHETKYAYFRSQSADAPWIEHIVRIYTGQLRCG